MTLSEVGVNFHLRVIVLWVEAVTSSCWGRSISSITTSSFWFSSFLLSSSSFSSRESLESEYSVVESVTVTLSIVVVVSDCDASNNDVSGSDVPFPNSWDSDSRLMVRRSTRTINSLHDILLSWVETETGKFGRRKKIGNKLLQAEMCYQVTFSPDSLHVFWHFNCIAFIVITPQLNDNRQKNTYKSQKCAWIYSFSRKKCDKNETVEMWNKSIFFFLLSSLFPKFLTWQESEWMIVCY